MPIYTYRREDGTEFDIRQQFSDDPLTVDPETGQKVVRVIQPAGIVFRGSGFYVNDSKGAKSNLNGNGNGNGSTNGKDSAKDSGSKTDTTSTADTTATTAEKSSSSNKDTKPA